MPLLVLTLFAADSSPKPINLSHVLGGLLHALLPLWPLWLLIGLGGAGKLALELYQLRRLSRSGIAEVDQMDGKTFETFLGTLFRGLGYGVEVTRYRGDYGADLVIAKNGSRTAVQAKRWNKPIGVKAVQEAVAAKGYYRCDSALVVANREFTQQAKTLARANAVELWGRETLIAKMLEVGEPPDTRPETSHTPPLDDRRGDQRPRTVARLKRHLGHGDDASVENWTAPELPRLRAGPHDLWQGDDFVV